MQWCNNLFWPWATNPFLNLFGAKQVWRYSCNPNKDSILYCGVILAHVLCGNSTIGYRRHSPPIMALRASCTIQTLMTSKTRVSSAVLCVSVIPYLVYLKEKWPFLDGLKIWSTGILCAGAKYFGSENGMFSDLLNKCAVVFKWVKFKCLFLNGRVAFPCKWIS